MTRRDEIFAVLIDFARTHSGNSPSVRGLWQEYMRVCKRKMAYGVFLRHIGQLEGEGRIIRRDGEIIITGSQWGFGGINGTKK